MSHPVTELRPATIFLVAILPLAGLNGAKRAARARRRFGGALPDQGTDIARRVGAQTARGETPPARRSTFRPRRPPSPARLSALMSPS